MCRLRSLFAVCALTIGLFGARGLAAQELIKFAPPKPLAVAAPGAPATAEPAERSADSEKKFPGGAPLKTDVELEQLLTRAEQFASDGRYDLAAVLWQKVLDETGDTLFTRDGRIYFGLSAEVERILKEMGGEALKVYRVSADGEAQAVLAAGEQSDQGQAAFEAALARVVRRYFLSSAGDDAAFQLGCLALDRHDFVGAYRLFTKILDQHPDPSMPRADVLLRLAVASSRIGDHAAAANALASIESDSEGLGDGLLAEVKKEIDRAKTSAAAVGVSAQDYRMTLGGPERRGVMPALPAELTSSTLRELWTLTIPVSSGGGSSAAVRGGVRVIYNNAQPQALPATPEAIVQRWIQNQWMPAGQLLFADGKVFIKTNNDLACWDLSSPSERPIWRSTWLNTFQLDAHTQTLAQMGWQANAKRPFQSADVQFFGDRIHQSMSIAGGLVFNLEGMRVARHSERMEITGPQQQQAVGFQYGVTPRRSRKNWLAAYELGTGKARWRRGADDAAKNDDTEVGFMAAPVPYGNLLLAPITDGGAIWLLGMAVETGATVWKTYLCDEPSGGCSPWSPVSVSVSGSDAYVLCGAGVVFSVDAVSGAIRYGVRYSRDGDPNEQARNMGYGTGMMLNLKGFEEDAAIAYGRALIVMASDHDGLFALDQRSGDVLWRTPRTPFDLTVNYCLGLVDGGLYLAGTNVVRKYDAAGGKLLWERPTAEMYGRGALTSDAVYMPIKGQVGAAVLKLDLKTGEVLSQAGVSYAERGSDLPLGNLFSDGEKLWALSGQRVSMLADDKYEGRALDRRIDSGDGAALLERARLLLSQGKIDDAVADFEAVYRKQAATKSEHLVADAIVAILAEQRIFASKPHAALAIVSRLAEWERKAGRPLSDALTARLRGAVGNLATVDSPSSVPLLIEAASNLPASDWPLVARAVCRSAAPEHVEQLRRAIDGSPAAIAASAEALAKAAGEAAVDPLIAQLGAENPWTKLAVARALARLEKRESLSPLVSLLEADDSSTDAQLRMQADFVLRKVTGQDFSFDPFAAPDKRASAATQWSEFVGSEAAAGGLAPLGDEPAEAGFTLVSCGQQNMAISFDRQGNERARFLAAGAWACEALPDGGALFAHQSLPILSKFEASGELVWGLRPAPAKKEDEEIKPELNSRGEEIWSATTLTHSASSIERLPSGNMLVACPDASKVIEISAKGGLAWEFEYPGGKPFDAHRLPSGATLLTAVVAEGNDGRISEVSPAGKELWAAAGLAGIVRARRTASGNLLVVQSGQNRVSEIDAQGKTIWSKDGLNTPTDVLRLAGGNTLIVDSGRVLEVDSRGAVVSEKAVAGAMGISRY